MLVIEALLIGLFFVFWAKQTVELHDQLPGERVPVGRAKTDAEMASRQIDPPPDHDVRA